MANIFKRQAADGKAIWYIAYRDEYGRNRTRSIGRIDRRTAEKVLKAYEGQRAMGIVGIQPSKKQYESLSDFLKRHKQYSRSNKAQKTAEMDERYLKTFADFIGDKTLPLISPEDCEGFVRHRLSHLAPTSVNMEIRHLKAAFNRAVEWEVISANPWERIKLIRVPESDVPAFLEMDDIAKLRDAIKGHVLEPLVEFYLLTGARLREGTSLTGEDVDLRRNVLHIRGEKTKSKRNRTIPFSQLPGLRELLAAQHPRKGEPVFKSNKNPGNGWDADWVKKVISRTLTKIGCPWASTHTLRHTFASHLVMSGVELWTVSKLLGHSSVTVTEQHYAHLAPSHAEQAISKLPYASNSGNSKD